MLHKNNLIKSIAKSAFSLALVFGATQASAGESSVLNSNDFVGISFWLISMALIASTVFFFLERDRVSANGKHP